MRSSFFKKTNTAAGKEVIRLNRKVVTFIICLLGSTFFWLMLTLSKEYTITLSFPVRYINAPPDKVISNDLPSAIDIDVRAKGFSLITYKINRQREIIDIDLRDARPLYKANRAFLLTNSRTDKVTSQFPASVKIIRIMPDTIRLNFNKRVTRKIPVKADVRIECAPEYAIADSIISNPLFVEVSGSADDIEKLDTVYTEPVRMKNVQRSLLLNPGLVSEPSQQLQFNPAKVKVAVHVAKFTEGSMELPVEVDNLPVNYSLKTFPDKVTVRYNVAYENYGKINPSQFRAVVDYSKIEAGSNKLKIQLTRVPPEVRAVRLNTDKAEFIIRK